MNESDVVLLDFRSILESAPDGMAVVAPSGQLLVVNDRFSELFGYETEELIGQEVRMLIPERLRDVHRDHRRRYVEHPTKRAMGLGLELVGIHKSGREIPVEISLSPVRAGAQVLTIAAVRDVSDQQRLKEEQMALRSVLDTEQERYRIGMDLHDGVMQTSTLSHWASTS
jgi:protein-histidine pros-kinase